MAITDSRIGYQAGSISPGGGGLLASRIGFRTGAIPAAGAYLDSRIGYAVHRLSAPTHVTPRAWTPAGWADGVIVMWTGAEWRED